MKLAIALLWGLVVLGAIVTAIWVLVFGEPKVGKLPARLSHHKEHRAILMKEG